MLVKMEKLIITHTKKYLIAISSLLLCLMFLSACGRDGDPASIPYSEHKPTHTH